MMFIGIQRKHYRILDTYGINRKDWDIMKDINKDEGGVGKYFEGAEDDHSLFQKRIIPTVSQVLASNGTSKERSCGNFQKPGKYCEGSACSLKKRASP